ncbi:Disease resistance protein [Vigna angularis]|uniref:Disease resistance protein n=1 Tax=Phaseolus angularis TaxID=3914 RepID=A0A8T0JQW7_PHAAN|nr:Disease resistance protein [Vigna angularis]
MDFLRPFGRVVEGLVDFVWKHGVRQVTYIVNYNKNVFELKDSVKDLALEKERINHQREEAEKNLNNIEGKVIEWDRKVCEIETTVEVFTNDDGHTKARSPNCFVFPYLWNRHRLGRQAHKMKDDVKRLIGESPELDEVFYRQNVTSNDATLSNCGFVEFSSIKSIIEKVMIQLQDSAVRMIGLYGRGGVGKSTLVKEIARKAKEKKLFDVVVKVEITADPNPHKIQEEIAYVLGLRLEGEGENVRADCLRRRLKKDRGNILLIFDDLWHKLDLNKLGIPIEDYHDDEDFNRQKADNKDGNNDPSSKVLKKENILGGHKGCKILLTSRDKNVLCVEMDVKSTFCVRELDDKDSLILFQKLAGIHNEMSSSKQEIVKKYCEGLPMAIVVVARALRNKSESVWEATMKRHKKHELVGEGRSMDISVKMSYEHLENEEIKSIFLLCAQMGRRALIMDLVKYCFGLGILEGVSSLWEAREKIKTSIEKLKDSGLLLDESSNNHFYMHDMVRDTALSIAHKDHNAFNLRNGKLDDWPELEKCTSIFMCNSDIIDGLEVINCPQLKLFQIDTNDPYLKIPKSFFRRMTNLRVLIMTGFRVSNLPSSIQYLSKLRMLCLQQCTLDCNLSIIGKLKKLRILSFSGSILKNLPIELQCLDKLRMLDISDCSELKIIPPNVISSLTCLEELYIRESLIKMLVERETNKGHYLFLSELKNLHQLKVVELSIPCVSNFPNHLFFDKLRDYNIVIGDFGSFSLGKSRMFDKHETFRVLAVQLKDNTNIHSQENIKLLFKTVQTLLLGNINGVREVVNDLDIDGFQDLKHLSIINNNDIKYVNSTKLCNYVNVFPNLESLCLYNMGKLDMICYGPVIAVSFAKLRTIKVEMCHRLKNLYSLDMVKFPIAAQTCDISECSSYMDIFLSSLEIIEVSECKSLKEIFQIPKNYGKVEFPKLHTLTLRLLPLFSCFYTKVDKFCWPHLAKAQTTIRGHKELTSAEDKQSDEEPLFGELVEIPNLETLNLSSLKIHKIWNYQNSSSFTFQNLIKLVVKDCDKLTHLCLLSIARSLNKLKSLVISECPVMEKIFETERNNVDKMSYYIKWKHVQQWSTCSSGSLDFCAGSEMTLYHSGCLFRSRGGFDSQCMTYNGGFRSSLISVKIEECNKLDKIFPSHMEGWFDSLDNLKVNRCKSVEVIFEINDSQEIDEFGGIDTKLQIILLEGLPKLKQLWSTDPNGILNFKKLRTIDVGFCHELKNLFPVSIAKDVPKLEHMSILECDKMEEIVVSQDASEANKDLLAFPELTFVRLHRLSNMKYFYKKKYPIKCPKLKELSVGQCVQLKTFPKDTIKTTNKEGNFVFSIEEVFPNLEHMEIDFNEAQELLPKYQMHRLKELTLISVKSVDLLNKFPYRIPNLEKLKFESSYFEELVPRANIGRQKKLGIVLQLKELVFFNSNIKDLGFERDQVLQRLEVLRLEWCYELRNLAPPSVSLIYLTHLELKDCFRLKNLMASSTAKSMVQLKTMKVIDCDKIEQIISMEESEEGKVMKIVFSKLISIELVRLNNLTSFCSHKECEFEFSSLEILIVRECEKMEKFSEKRSIAPKLKNIFGVEGDEKTKWQWEGDLNATIHKIFNDKVSFAYTEFLWLKKDTLVQLRHGKHWEEQNSFSYLKYLDAWGCHTVVHIIPSHLLSCFHNLEELYVRNCSNAEVIFNMNEENRVMTKPSRLKTLYLDYLPQLKHVWDKDPKGITGLHVLEEVHVSRCGRLKSLFPASVAKDLTGLEVFKVKRCEKLEEIFRKDERIGDEEGSTQESVFHRLTTLTLQELPRLNYSIHCSNQQAILTLFTLSILTLIISIL